MLNPSHSNSRLLVTAGLNFCALFSSLNQMPLILSNYRISVLFVTPRIREWKGSKMTRVRIIYDYSPTCSEVNNCLVWITSDKKWILSGQNVTGKVVSASLSSQSERAINGYSLVSDIHYNEKWISLHVTRLTQPSEIVKRVVHIRPRVISCI